MNRNVAVVCAATLVLMASLWVYVFTTKKANGQVIMGTPEIQFGSDGTVMFSFGTPELPFNIITPDRQWNPCAR